MNPQLLVKVNKKLKTLTFEYEGDKIVLDIDNNEIDLIILDEWITQLLKKEWDRVQLRKKLAGK